ncbi:MAG: PAS domain-containing protein [Actinomycetota bacterium]
MHGAGGGPGDGGPEPDRFWDGLESAEAYRSLAEGVPAILYIDAADELSTNLYTSPQLEPLLGYSTEEWVSRPQMFVELLHPDDRERVVRENEESNRTGEFTTEYRLLASDGRIVWFRDEAALVRDAAGRPRFWRGVMQDITERKRNEDKLRRSLEILRRTMDQRRELMHRVEEAQEQERRRIAADIHDDPIQVMSAADMRVQALLEQVGGVDEGQVRTALEEVHEAVAQSIERLRHLLFELRPPSLDKQGLAAALEIYLDYVGREAGFASAVRSSLEGEPPSDAASILFRIAQEAVANVRKHARATTVAVRLEPQDDGVLLRITDDGIGFDPTALEDPAPGHLGMSAMPERAELAGGWCRVESTPGTGTTVECWIPVEPTAGARSTA